MNTDLFSSYTLGDLTLANKMVMAPMTRNRAAPGAVMNEMHALYYEQRASAGLIITEATQISPEGVGYPGTPGIHSDEQVAGWKKVTQAVHNAGGKIFIQLWYCGRISHPSLLPDAQTPVAPSAIRPQGEAITPQGMQPYVTPRALEIEEIQDIVAQYKQAAEMAKLAEFDGIEVHAANGYLIDQFLRDGSNHRTDEYGGSAENRMRLLNEVLDAVLQVWPANRVGVRLTPENSFNSMTDSDPLNHFSYFIQQLNTRNLAYLHILEGDMMNKQRTLDYTQLRKLFNSTYIANNAYDRDSAQQHLSANNADLIAFGMPFLANPDLVHRYQIDAPLNEANEETLYGGAEEGYNDYPFYQE